MKYIKTITMAVLLSTVLTACQNDLPLPDGQSVVNMVSKASSLSADFDITPMDYSLDTCISLSSPGDIQAYNKLQDAGRTDIFCEARDLQTLEPISYTGWTDEVKSVYGGDVLAEFLKRVPKLPAKSTSFYVHDGSKLWVDTNAGGRGSSLGLVQEWDKATAVQEGSMTDKNTASYEFTLPYYNDHEEQESLTEEEKKGKVKREIELIYVDGEWRLNTLIDTLGR